MRAFHHLIARRAAWCERGDSNPHGYPLDPKSSASAIPPLSHSITHCAAPLTSMESREHLCSCQAQERLASRGVAPLAFKRSKLPMFKGPVDFGFRVEKRNSTNSEPTRVTESKRMEGDRLAPPSENLNFTTLNFKSPARRRAGLLKPPPHGMNVARTHGEDVFPGRHARTGEKNSYRCRSRRN